MNLKTHLQLVNNYYNKIKKIFFLTTTKKYLVEAFKFNADTVEHFKYIAKLAKIENSGLKILDCGCGFGEPQNILNSLYPLNTFYGVTINDYQVKHKRHANVFLMNYDNLNFQSNNFDRVLFLESLQHSFKLKNTLNEAYRILKPGGILFILDGFMNKDEFDMIIKSKNIRYNYRKYRDYFGSYRFSMNALLKIARKTKFKLMYYQTQCKNYEKLIVNNTASKIANFLYFGDLVSSAVSDYGYAVFVKE